MKKKVFLLIGLVIILVGTKFIIGSNFISKFAPKSKTHSYKVVLNDFYLAQKKFYEERNRFAKSFTELNYKNLESNFEIVLDDERMKILCPKCRIDKHSYLVVAISKDLANKGVVWSIDNEKNLKRIK
jgi:hypothetical protein